MIREFEEKVKFAVSLVKLLTPQEKLEAVTIWNTFSSEFQSVIDSTVGKNPLVGFGKCFQKDKPQDVTESLDLSLSSDRALPHFTTDSTFPVQQNSSEQPLVPVPDVQIPSPIGCERLNLDDLVNHNDMCSATGFSSENVDSWADLLAPSAPSDALAEALLPPPSEAPRPSVITDNRPMVEKEQRSKTHVCSVCQMAFPSKEQLNDHLASHANEKPFTCTQCNAKYRQLSSLKRHLASHQGVRNFQCTICMKRFAEKKTLMTHQRTHTGEKPFLCGQCGVAFAQQATLLNHNLQVHQKGSRRFKCQVCPASFSGKGKLDGHMNKHNNKREFKCEYCDKAFYSKDDKVRHQNTHVQPKRFQCDKCKQLFRRNEYLKQHLVMCLKEPVRLTCVHCSKAFASTSLHSRHVNRCALKDIPPPAPVASSCLFDSSRGEYVVP